MNAERGTSRPTEPIKPTHDFASFAVFVQFAVFAPFSSFAPFVQFTPFVQFNNGHSKPTTCRRSTSAVKCMGKKTKKRTSLEVLFFVVPPGNIIKRVTYCVLVLLMFSLIRCSRIAHGHNSPFFTTPYRLFSTVTKVVNFPDFRARKREYNFVAAEPKYRTPCRASCQAVQQTTQVHHHDIAAMCV